MLRSLTADDPRFKDVEFKAGLNLLVAETTAVSTRTDSNNGVGKSSLIELLHFLLGARVDRGHLTTKNVLSKTAFRLKLDWPGLDEPLDVFRRGASAKWVDVWPALQTESGALWGESALPVAEWQSLIESGLFGLRGEHPGVSGRTLLSFLIRKVGDHGFNEATRSFARQPETQAAPNLAYLLGLDSALAARYQELAAKKTMRDQLKKAVNDPVWGRVVGRTADLRGEITLQHEKIGRLRRQIDGFRVVEEYEALKDRADAITSVIQDLSTADAVDRRNLDHLEKSIAETSDPEVRYLERVYADLGVVLGDQVRRRFDEVRDFHTAVVRNRRTYLADEIKATRERLDSRVAERARLDEERSRLLRAISEGGALDALTMLQQALGREQASLEALQHRFEAAQTVEASSRELTVERAQLAQAVDADLGERRHQIDQAILLFSDFAHRVYSTNRLAYLAIEAGPNSLRIQPTIDSDDSQGINKMTIFCFDLTLSVIAHREGRGPDFLVHDSHIFDGVDGRQVASALELARTVAETERMQYIATINQGTLDEAGTWGFDPGADIIAPRLTDAYEDGGLFGFHFGR